MHPSIRLVTVLAITGALAAACGDSGSDNAASTSPATSASAPTEGATSGVASLKGICPATVVIQTDWYATPERAASYQLVGPNGKIDAKKGTYSGPLGDTGIDVQVRLGGPFIGFAPVPQQMYTDDAITLGLVATDDAIAASAKYPTTAVVSPLDINPQVILWDPATYTVNSWKDVAGTGAKIAYVEGMPYMDWLVAKGLVKKSQLDAAFDGTPSRFVASGGKLMQQAYASNEPYRWEHDVPEWNKPVKSLLVHDAGYEIYPQGVSVRSKDLDSLKPCLAKLVPLIQQAQVDYTKDPSATNDALVKIGAALKDGPPITADANAQAVKTMLELKLVGNGSDSTLGDMDSARVQRVIDALKPVLTAKGVDVPADLTPEKLATNEFLDKSIGL